MSGLLGALPARAATYDFTFTETDGAYGSTPYILSGSFVTGAAVTTAYGTGFDILSATGTIQSPNQPSSISFTLAGSANPSGSQEFWPNPPGFNGGAYDESYDDVFYPSGTTQGSAPFTNYGGPLFVSNTGFIYNIYLGAGGPNNDGGCCGTYPSLYLTTDENGWPISGLPYFPGVIGEFGFNAVTGVDATPLPSTWTMLIAGFVGLGFFAYQGTKKRSAAIAAV
jgi:hypothetical protein